MSIKPLLLIFFISLHHFLFSQTGNSFNPFFYSNNYLDNPSDISTRDIKMGLTNSLKRTNFPIASATTTYFTLPVYQQQLGAGIRLSANTMGGLDERVLGLGTTYNLLISGDTLAVGLESELRQRAFKTEQLFVEDNTDPFLAASVNNRAFQSTFNVGLQFSPKEYTFSFAVKNIKSLVFTSHTQSNQLSLWAARVFEINRGFKLRPGIKMDKFNRRKTVYTLISEGQFSDIGGIAIAYLTTKTVSAQVSVYLNRYFKVFDPIQIGYAYQYNLSNETFYHQLNHQFFLNYSFRKKPRNSQIRKSDNSTNPNYY